MSVSALDKFMDLFSLSLLFTPSRERSGTTYTFSKIDQVVAKT